MQEEERGKRWRMQEEEADDLEGGEGDKNVVWEQMKVL